MSAPPPARGPALLAAALGLGHAAVSAYWLAGGTALLDGIGGDIEEWARARSGTALAGLAVVVALKLVVALAAPAYAGMGATGPARPLVTLARRRPARVLGRIAAAVLVLQEAERTGRSPRPTRGDLAWKHQLHSSADPQRSTVTRAGVTCPLESQEASGQGARHGPRVGIWRGSTSSTARPTGNAAR
ncbi:MAG TPA: hypothetical protein VFI47_22775 [Acidimicrobiales bacterium]|nr:hypothetical protein [Acidimicrobiales bacterium]